MVNEEVTMTMSVLPGAMTGISTLMGGLVSINNIFMDLTRQIDASFGLVDTTIITASTVVAQFGFQAAQAFGEFEQGMKIAQMVSNQTAQDMDLLKTKANEFAVSYRTDIDQITEGLQTLGRAGLNSASEQTEVLKEGLSTAKLESRDLNGVLEELIQNTALLGGNLNSSDFGENSKYVNDLLVATSMTAPITTHDVSETLKYSGGIAAAAGANIESDAGKAILEDYMGAIAAFAQKGVTGSIAGTALRAFFNKPATQDESVKNALATIHLKPEYLWEDDEETMKPVSEQIAIIENQMKELDISTMDKLQIWSKIVGGKMGQQMMKLESSDIKTLTRDIQQADDAGSLAAGTFQTFQSNMKEMTEQGQVAFRSFGENVARFLNPVLDIITKILEMLSNPAASMALFAGFVSFLTLAASKIKNVFSNLKSEFSTFMEYFQKGEDLYSIRPSTVRKSNRLKDKKQTYNDDKENIISTVQQSDSGRLTIRRSRYDRDRSLNKLYEEGYIKKDVYTLLNDKSRRQLTNDALKKLGVRFFSYNNKGVLGGREKGFSDSEVLGILLQKNKIPEVIQKQIAGKEVAEVMERYGAEIYNAFSDLVLETVKKETEESVRRLNERKGKVSYEKRLENIGTYNQDLKYIDSMFLNDLDVPLTVNQQNEIAMRKRRDIARNVILDDSYYYDTLRAEYFKAEKKHIKSFQPKGVDPSDTTHPNYNHNFPQFKSFDQFVMDKIAPGYTELKDAGLFKGSLEDYIEKINYMSEKRQGAHASRFIDSWFPKNNSSYGASNKKLFGTLTDQQITEFYHTNQDRMSSLKILPQDLLIARDMLRYEYFNGMDEDDSVRKFRKKFEKDLKWLNHPYQPAYDVERGLIDDTAIDLNKQSTLKSLRIQKPDKYDDSEIFANMFYSGVTGLSQEQLFRYIQMMNPNLFSEKQRFQKNIEGEIKRFETTMTIDPRLLFSKGTYGRDDIFNMVSVGGKKVINQLPSDEDGVPDEEKIADLEKFFRKEIDARRKLVQNAISELYVDPRPLKEHYLSSQKVDISKLDLNTQELREVSRILGDKRYNQTKKVETFIKKINTAQDEFLNNPKQFYKFDLDYLKQLAANPEKNQKVLSVFEEMLGVSALSFLHSDFQEKYLDRATNPFAKAKTKSTYNPLDDPYPEKTTEEYSKIIEEEEEKKRKENLRRATMGVQGYSRYIATSSDSDVKKQMDKGLQDYERGIHKDFKDAEKAWASAKEARTSYTVKRGIIYDEINRQIKIEEEIRKEKEKFLAQIRSFHTNYLQYMKKSESLSFSPGGYSKKEVEERIRARQGVDQNGNPLQLPGVGRYNFLNYSREEQERLMNKNANLTSRIRNFFTKDRGITDGIKGAFWNWGAMKDLPKNAGLGQIGKGLVSNLLDLVGGPLMVAIEGVTIAIHMWQQEYQKYTENLKKSIDAVKDAYSKRDSAENALLQTYRNQNPDATDDELDAMVYETYGTLYDNLKNNHDKYKEIASKKASTLELEYDEEKDDGSYKKKEEEKDEETKNKEALQENTAALYVATSELNLALSNLTRKMTDSWWGLDGWTGDLVDTFAKFTDSFNNWGLGSSYLENGSDFLLTATQKDENYSGYTEMAGLILEDFKDSQGDWESGLKTMMGTDAKFTTGIMSSSGRAFMSSMGDFAYGSKGLSAEQNAKLQASMKNDQKSWKKLAKDIAKFESKNKKSYDSKKGLTTKKIENQIKKLQSTLGAGFDRTRVLQAAYLEIMQGMYGVANTVFVPLIQQNAASAAEAVVGVQDVGSNVGGTGTNTYNTAAIASSIAAMLGTIALAQSAEAAKTKALLGGDVDGDGTPNTAADKKIQNLALNSESGDAFMREAIKQSQGDPSLVAFADWAQNISDDTKQSADHDYWGDLAKGSRGLAKMFGGDRSAADYIAKVYGITTYMSVRGMDAESAEKEYNKFYDEAIKNGASPTDILLTLGKNWGWEGFTKQLEDAYNMADDGTGDGSGGGGGSGSGDKDKDNDNGTRKERVDLVLCNRKTIPKLNVNLFKKPPSFTILNKNFKLRDVKINSEDKPKAIMAAIKNSFIDIQKRTDPKIIQDEDAVYDPAAATDGTNVPSGSAKTNTS